MEPTRQECQIVTFSIVIPCFNRSVLLERALRSCVRQSYDDFEVIVVDDGSEEDLARVVTAMGDARVKYHRQDNAGVSAARNAGIDLASGEWIAFLDSDDVFRSNKLEVVKHAIDVQECDMVISRAEIFRGTGSVWATPQLNFARDDELTEFMFSRYQVIPTSTFVVRTRVASEIRFDDTLSLCEDIDFIVRVAGNAHAIAMVPDVLVGYDDSAESGRLSRVVHGDLLETWLKDSAEWFSPRGYYGYRATYLSKYLAKKKPAVAFKDLVGGYRRGGVSLPLTVRRGLRAFFPRLYDVLVARYLSIRSSSEAEDALVWSEVELGL